MENFEKKKSTLEKIRDIAFSKPAKIFGSVVAGVMAFIGVDKMTNSGEATDKIARELFGKSGGTETTLTQEQMEKTMHDNQQIWRDAADKEYGRTESQNNENVSTTDQQ